MPLTNSSVAASVRAELARAGVSGRQLAKDLGWSAGKTHRRLAGSEPFRIDELVQVAEHLGIPVATFLPEARAEKVS